MIYTSRPKFNEILKDKFSEKGLEPNVLMTYVQEMQSGLLKDRIGIEVGFGSFIGISTKIPLNILN